MQTQPVPPIQRWHRCNRAQAMTHNLHTHGMTCSRSSKHGRLMDVGLARPHSQKMLICDLEQQRTCSARTSSPSKPHVTHRRPSWSLTPASIPHDRAGTRAQEDEEEIVGRGDVAEDGAEHQRQTNDEASVLDIKTTLISSTTPRKEALASSISKPARTRKQNAKSEQREDTPAGRATCTCFPNRYLVTVSKTSQRRQKDHVEVAGKPMGTCRG